MNILYITTILAIYILLMLIHKTEKKQNILTWLPISVVLIFCYNIFICLICTFIGVLCSLVNLSICNSILIAILTSILLKTKKVQKYYFKIGDLAFAGLLLVLVGFIAYKQYGFPFNIKYEITDGSTHYFFAQQFYENSTLLFNKTTDDILGIYNSNFRLPGAYINQGILFKVFEEVIYPVDVFILFDIFILYLSGILFYQLLQDFSKSNNKLKPLAMIFSIMYVMGYQLNSMLYGYVYLSFALVIIIAFLILMQKSETEEMPKIVALPILSLISLGIFFSYAYFIPIIYIAIIIKLIIKSVKNKQKILCAKNLMTLVYLIIIPLILGVTYFIIFPIINNMKTEISTIGVQGAIYENYITNYLCFIPIFLISIILLIKNKDKNENNYSSILFILSIIFAIILLIGNKLEIVSRYYFFKAYYVIWILAIYNFYTSLSYVLTQKNKTLKIITYIYIVIYILLLVIATLIFNKNAIDRNEYILKHEELNILKKVENSI